MQPRTNYVNEMDRFLSECQSIYNELKDQCTDIDTLLSEYGYVGANTSNMYVIKKSKNQHFKISKTDVCFLFHSRSHSESEHSSILAPEHMESLLISSPGDYLLKNLDDDDDYQENTSPNNAVIIMNKPTCIKTPVIKSLASVLKTENSEMYGLQSTPLCSLRAEPTYSPYYYSKK